MGRPELAADPRYQTHSARGAHQQELDDIITAWTQTLDADALEAKMEEHAIPAGRIFRAPDMLADPHFQARQSIVTVMHKQFGTLAMQNVAPRLSETPGEVRHTGPELGEHNAQVLQGILGLDAAALARLAAAKVI
jgi:formyl-CoA transferase